jgi:hypothetical protein
MSRQVLARPLWSDAPDLRLTLGRFARMSESTIEREIGRLKAEQDAYLQRLDQRRQIKVRPGGTVFDQPAVRRRPTPTPQPPVVTTRRQTRPQPATVRAVWPVRDALAGVHPVVRADALRRADGDVRRLRVLGPDRVLVLNQPCGD